MLALIDVKLLKNCISREDCLASMPSTEESQVRSTEQLELLESIFKAAYGESDWPKRNRMKIPHDERGGNFDSLERSIGTRFLVLLERAWNDQRLRLTLAGAALCRRGAPIVEAFLSLVREA